MVDPFSVEFVVRMWPLYGPVAGGTRVTITGQFVNAQLVTSVYFNDTKRYPDTNRLVCPQSELFWICFSRITYETFIVLPQTEVDLHVPLFCSRHTD